MRRRRSTINRRPVRVIEENNRLAGRARGPCTQTIANQGAHNLRDWLFPYLDRFGAAYGRVSVSESEQKRRMMCDESALNRIMAGYLVAGVMRERSLLLGISLVILSSLCTVGPPSGSATTPSLRYPSGR